jgi:protein involved in polysaccharide export with SLBB domain
MTVTRLINRYASLARLIVPATALSLLLGCSTIHNLFGESSSPKPKTPAATGDEVAGRLRAGDEVVVRIDTGGAQAATPVPSDLTIDEDGNISLPLIGSIKAAGLTGSELAERIQANYVPRYYVRCNASVMVAARFFYVGGEVRNPNRFPWSEDTSLLKAISTAGGFTDYANRQKVQLIRGGILETYNCEDLQRNPAKDPTVRPGDTITVPRSIF